MFHTTDTAMLKFHPYPSLSAFSVCELTGKVNESDSIDDFLSESYNESSFERMIL